MPADIPRNKPFARIWRPGRSFDKEKENCLQPVNRDLISAFALIESDLKGVFSYIEPDFRNLDTFSIRNYELLLRSCTEVESLFRLAMVANGHDPKKPKANIIRYSDFENPMKLSEYSLHLPGYNIPEFFPFKEFSAQKREDRSPPWYRGYNSVKHNRYEKFSDASLGNAIHSVGALYVLLHAQIGNIDRTYATVMGAAVSKRTDDLFKTLKTPSWPEHECYEGGAGFDDEQKHPLPSIADR